MSFSSPSLLSSYKKPMTKSLYDFDVLFQYGILFVNYIIIIYESARVCYDITVNIEQCKSERTLFGFIIVRFPLFVLVKAHACHVAPTVLRRYLPLSKPRSVPICSLYYVNSYTLQCAHGNLKSVQI